MRPLDWAVLIGSVVFIVCYGLWRGRRSDTTQQYLLAGKEMPWYAMALSIMATQASAITFISTTGQAFSDGMRFIQFYFGLPLAMILVSATAVPIFHRAGVYTAYEYLEKRFDAKTRALVTFIFLIQRGLAVGVALYAPAIVLTVLLGWNDQITTLLMGVLVVFYTTLGGIKAVTWTDFQQMVIMIVGLLASLIAAIFLLPADVSLLEAVNLAGAAGRLNAVVLTFDPNDRYNIWSGVIGGTFLALAYFGCDQSQVQRYLTGKSIAQSRLSLLFNAVAKIPMQFLILFTGTMVYVFYLFVQPPIVFHPGEMKKIEQRADAAQLQSRFDAAWKAREQAARTNPADLKLRQAEIDQVRKDAGAPNDANYVFLGFVIKYLPAGLVGLVMAAIFAAAMSTISGEINSLATVTVIDVYQRHIAPHGNDGQYLWASRLATVFWGGYAVVTAKYGASLGSLIEAVNMLGSLFYGGLLGVFVLAFYFPRVGANAAFAGVLLGEAAIFAAWAFTGISFLWYNVVGALVVIGSGWLISRSSPPAGSPAT